MPRETYVFDPASGELVDRDIYYSRQPAPKRSHLPCPMLALDTMDEVQSQASGRVYTSKSALRAEYRALGMVEIGNDPARLRPVKPPKIDDAAISQTIDKAAARYARGERASKA